ncbi:hypothetical protein [Streptacidiphilus sp. EB129]|uniref:hypothetical protein n=1 Tax=Streptacidiphilus sp. EB129 TaxID=3156262 RepID=UPI00351550D1
MSTDTSLPEFDDTAEPSGLSRRGLIRNAAGAGAVGLAAGALLGTAAGPAAAGVRGEAEPRGAVEAEPATVPGSADSAEQDPVIVHLRDAGSGELDIYRGETHQRVQDPKLAAQLLRAAR